MLFLLSEQVFFNRVKHSFYLDLNRYRDYHPSKVPYHCLKCKERSSEIWKNTNQLYELLFLLPVWNT